MIPAAGEVVVNTTDNRLHIGNGSTAGGIPSPTFLDERQQTFVYPTVGGTADAITLTNAPVVASYAAPLRLVFKATGTNTTAVTVNVDSIGTKNVKKMLNGALASLTAGDIVSGGFYEIIYDGTQFQIKGLGTSTPPSQYLTLIQAQTASGAASVDFTSGIDSTYSYYMLVASNVTTSSAGSVLRCRVQQGGSFVTSSSYRNAFSSTDGSSTAYVNGLAAFATITPGALSGTAAEVASAVIEFFRPDLAVNLSMIYRSQTYRLSTARRGDGAATVVTSAATTGIQLLCSTGNISGTFKLYGVT